jgi:tetratricopeptide (TPR) repeat protein
MTAVHRSEDASLESLVARVVDDFLERQKRGEQPDPGEYAARHPEAATVLREVLAALQIVGLSSAASRARDRVTTGAETAPAGTLGDFRIVREIGRGGMGVVYEAEQISLSRRVALKILPFAAALDPRQLRRFKNEAHAAAQLQHQSIVPVYYVGCERGVHFYAMQYIDGQTLATFIRELQQNVEGPITNDQRMTDNESQSTKAQVPEADAQTTIRHSTLDLLSSLGLGHSSFFRTVARLGMEAALALEHAHQQGIVHRDIKPANLLLEWRAGGVNPPVLWLTDFGLARLQNETSLTVSGDLVGTLRYMSPEQALGHPASVDHRTDIYSLGATLYELVSLCPAHGGRDRQEVLRQIASEDPYPLRRHNPAVPVELDTIIQKAMEKDALARYATARELADDLGRFLEDKPIRARPPSRLEQARKWARRHQPVVWSAAAGFLAVLAILAGSVGWVVRDRAAREATIATAVEAALEEAQRYLLEGNWPQSKAAATRAEALLKDSAAKPGLTGRVQEVLRELAEEEADRRLVARLEEIRLLQADVNVKEDRFLLERALPEYRRAFADYGLQAEARPPAETAALLRGRPTAVRATLIAALDHWLDLARREKSSEADWLEQVLSAADPDPWRQRLRAARRRGDRNALEQLAREVDLTAQPSQTVFLLDRSLDARGATDHSLALLRRTQEAFPGDFWTNENLGMALLDCRPPQLDEAIRFLTAAVALRPDSPGARVNLALALGDKGRLVEAITACRKAIDLKRDYGAAYYDLGSYLSKAGQLDEAVAAYRKAVELKAYFAEAYANLGGALAAKGLFDEAVIACRRAIELKPALPQPYFTLGNAWGSKGRLDDSIAAYRQAIDRKPDYAEAHCNLGVALDRMGRLEEASAAFREAADRGPDLFEAHFNLGHGLARLGRFGEAVAALRKATVLKPASAMAHYDLGNTLRQNEQLDDSVIAYRRAIALKPDYAEAYCNMAFALRQQGRFAQALAAAKRGHELGSRRPDWHYPSARWVTEDEKLRELEDRLPALLRGEAEPTSPEERVAYGLLCYDQKRFAALARLRAGTLNADLERADDLENGNRYEAACAAALAGCGQGTDAGQLDEKERVRWRKQALEWLQADLAAYAKRLKSGKPSDCQLVRQRLQGWQGDQDLAGLRITDAVAKLPLEEQKACQQLWAEVKALLAKTADGSRIEQPDR